MSGMPGRLALLRDRLDWPYGTQILAIALAVRVAAAILVPDQHFADAASYRSAAHSLWATGQLGDAIIMPLYPALVGLVGAGWGQLIVDIALSTLMVWLVHALTLAIFADRAAAFLAALATAFYPYFIFYALAGVTETLFIVLLLGAFVCWYRAHFAAAAVFTVLAILTRPTIDLLVPLLIVYFALVIHRFSAARTLRQLGAYVAIYAVLMAPWWLHNYRAYGTFVRLNLGGGIVFYSGNNAHNETGGSLDTDSDRKQFAGIADPVARDRAMWDAGLAYIKSNPGRFIELAGLKFVRFWRPWPYAPAYSGRAYVVMSVLTFVPVLVLAIIYLGIWGWREIALTGPVLALIGYFTLVHVVLAASLRYRLPLEPFLIVLASVAVARLARRWPASRSLLDRLAGEAAVPIHVDRQDLRELRISR
ncbi:MAG TPA: hypothetical protein VLX44_09945 [Xanthobacteraceae bacterium]|nr:hypothetical protein [Xanthobacteraceae bacterium]